MNVIAEGKLTFQGLAGWYLELKSVKNLKSYERIRICIRNFNKEFGDRIISQIRPVDLENYQNMRAEQQAAPATIDMEISIVKTMVTKAFDNDKVDGHVIKAFRRVKKRLPPAGNARDKILSVQDYKKLLQAASPYLRPILILAYNTGMRRAEILGLQWSQIDRENACIRLSAESVKERRAKVIPLNRRVRDALSQLPRAVHHDYVFSKNGEPVSIYTLKREMIAACKRAGLVYGMKPEAGFRFHDIRTTVKTNMLRAGIDKTMRDSILGHSLGGMDAYYLKPTLEDFARAMDRYAAWLSGQLEFENVDQNVDQDGE